MLDFVAHISSNFSTLITSAFFQVDDLLVWEEEIYIDVRSLETCAYSSTVFRDILNKIQKAVDDLSLKQYSNPVGVLLLGQVVNGPLDLFEVVLEDSTGVGA